MRKSWSAQFSPDGQRVVTASEDRDSAALGCGERKALGEPMKRERGRVRSVQPRWPAGDHRFVGRDSAALGCGERKGAGRADEA